MAGQTPRFGLNFFGGDNPGTFSDDSDKFTSGDRLTMDRLLAALEVHSHHATTALEPPDEPLDLQFTADGELDAGVEYFYTISFVNEDGLETAAGPESSLVLPDILPIPAEAQAETGSTTGSLPEGSYYYALSGLRGAEETPLSDPVNVTVLSDETMVTLTLPDLDDATSYQVWRMRDTDSGYTRIGTSSTATFIDDGSVPAGTYGDPANDPPLTNTGINAYSITVALTGDDLQRVTNAVSWRIYRSEQSGNYGAASLVHNVVEHTSDTDPTTALLTSWIDDGDASLTGSPKLLSQEMRVSAFTFDRADPLPDAADYPDYYPLLDGTDTLYIKRSGAWSPVTATRGVATFTGTGAPSPEPTGAQAGDLYFDLSTGDVYTLDGI